MTKFCKFARGFIAPVLLIFVLLLGGCGPRENSNMNPEERAAPRRGGVLNLASYTPDTLNPLCTQYACLRDYMYLVYEGLFTVNEDLSVKGVLAEGFKSRDNNTVFTISLKKGVKFHDGSAFTARDVVATFEYLQTYETNYSDALTGVKGYRAKDNYTVEITLEYPQVNFPANLDFPVLPSGLGGDAFSLPNTSFAVNGTGRYRYKKTNPYENIILRKNSDWHSDAKVYIPEVNIRFVDGENALAYAFNSGETDMVTTDYGRWGEFSYKVKHTTYELTTTKYLFLGLNTRSSAFSDVNLRQKLMAITDRGHIVDSVMFSHAQKADTPITSKAYFYRGDGHATDMELQGNFAEEKLSLYILYNEGSPEKENVARYLMTILEEAGVEVELTKVDFDTYRQKVSSGDYQIYIGMVDIKHDSNLRFMFPNATIPQVSVSAETGEEVVSAPSYTAATSMCDFSDPKLDDIIENINSAKNEETAKVAYNNLRLFYRQQVPQIPLVHINDAIFVSGRIKGKMNPSLTSFFADIGDIYLSEE